MNTKQAKSEELMRRYNDLIENHRNYSIEDIKDQLQEISDDFYLSGIPFKVSWEDFSQLLSNNYKESIEKAPNEYIDNDDFDDSMDNEDDFDDSMDNEDDYNWDNSF